MLIRSSKVTKEPFVLTVRSARNAVHAPTPASENEFPARPSINESSSPAYSGGDAMQTSDAELNVSARSLDAASASVAVAAISYAEYKERFRQELESMKESALQEGYREGEALARQQLEEEYAEKIQTLTGLVTSAREAVDGGIDALHEIGAEIVFEAVLKILGDALATREGVQAVVREVVQRAKDTTSLTIHLSPADVALIGDSRQALLSGVTGGDVKIVADERVMLGGCLLETPAGNLDGRLEVQLQCFRDALLSARIRRSEGGAS